MLNQIASKTSTRAAASILDREVWGISSETKGIEINLTGVFYPGSQKPPAGMVGVPMFELPVNNNEEVAYIHELLSSRKRRRKALETIFNLAQEGFGIYIPWQHIPRVDGTRYLQLLRRLNARLPLNRKLFVELAPTIPRWNILGGVDYGALNSLADRIVISLPISPQPKQVLCKNTLEELLWPILSQINSWKVLIRIPVYAVEWNVSEPDRPCGRLSYAEALTKAFRHGARLDRDEEGCLFYRYFVQGIQYHLRVPHGEPVHRIAAMVNRYNLAGVIVDQLGMEDPRLWNILRSHFRTAQFQ